MGYGPIICKGDNMRQITQEEVIGNFESVYESEQQAADLRSQANEISKDAKARLKEFADDLETTKTQISEAYRRYKALRQQTLNAEDEDYYTLITAVDEHFQAEDSEE